MVHPWPLGQAQMLGKSDICDWLQSRPRPSVLVELVENSPEVFGGVLQHLTEVDLRTLSAVCRLLRWATRDEALAADTQGHLTLHERAALLRLKGQETHLSAGLALSRLHAHLLQPDLRL